MTARMLSMENSLNARSKATHRPEALWVVVLQHVQRVQRGLDGRRCAVRITDKILWRMTRFGLSR